MVGGLVVGKALAGPQVPLMVLTIVMVRGVLHPLGIPLLSSANALKVYVPEVAQE
jgi:hypothetical protein